MQWTNPTKARCLKITEKVSFTIASEASYVYILSGQKFSKNWSNLASFWNAEAYGQKVLPDRSVSTHKISRKCQDWKFQMRHFDQFSNNVPKKEEHKIAFKNASLCIDLISK